MRRDIMQSGPSNKKSLKSESLTTARFQLVKNYMSRGFSPEDVSEISGLPIDIVNYEIDKLVKEAERYRRNRQKTLEGVNTTGGFGYHAVVLH
jgi:hypothetical protein